MKVFRRYSFLEIRPLEKMILTLISFVVLFGIYLEIERPLYFSSVYTKEDGFVEWLGFTALILLSFLSFMRVFSLRKEKSLSFLLVTLIFSFIFFFGAGEEISWGQRIFQINSSSFFNQYNSQGETNIHNLVINDVGINKLVFGKILAVVILIYFLVLPPLYSKFFFIRSKLNRFAIPLPRGYQIMTYLVFSIGVLLLQSAKRGELLEFLGCWSFLWIFYNPKNIDIFKKNDKISAALAKKGQYR